MKKQFILYLMLLSLLTSCNGKNTSDGMPGNNAADDRIVKETSENDTNGKFIVNEIVKNDSADKNTTNKTKNNTATSDGFVNKTTKNNTVTDNVVSKEPESDTENENVIKDTAGSGIQNENTTKDTTEDDIQNENTTKNTKESNIPSENTAENTTKNNSTSKNTADTISESDAHNGTPAEEATETVTSGFALIVDSEYLFSCDLPETWDYRISPTYSKSFYEQEGEREEGIRAFFYYSKDDPSAFIALVPESPSARKPFEGIAGETENYVFADGDVGMRRLFNGEYWYKEHIYHPASDYYVYLVTSKKDYLEHEDELRAFLNSIAFGHFELSEKVSEDADRPYRLHIWNEFLRAELTIKPGTTFYAPWKWDDTKPEYVFQYLMLHPDGMDTKLILEPERLLPIVQKDTRIWERHKFKSGLSAYRTTFEEDGQTVIEYDFIRSGCEFKIYGGETEQIMDIMDSFDVQ